MLFTSLAFHHAPISIEVKTAFTPFYAPHAYSQFHSFKWTNAKECKQQLKQAIHDFHQLSRRNAFLNPSIEIEIYNYPKKHRHALRKIFRALGKKQACIHRISFSDERSDHDLIQELHDIIQTRNKEIYRRRYNLFLYMLLYGLVGTFFAWGALLVVILFKVFSKMIYGAITYYLQQRYADFAMQHFKKKKQLRALSLHDHRQITALEKGALSGQSSFFGYLYYLQSFFSLSAWRHPVYFAAGEELAKQRKTKHLEIIHEKYARRIRT